MKTNIITYLIKTATENAIKKHLTFCSDNFIPSLASRINIFEYSKKISEKAITFEAWENDTLIGLIAVYFNAEGRFGFITNVSVDMAYMGTGIATKLLQMSIDYSKTNNYKEIILEVNQRNLPAISFYKKHNFKKKETKDDSLIMNYLINNN